MPAEKGSAFLLKVDDNASGVWSGRSGQIAIWVGADWRYARPTEGMRVRLRASESDIVHISGNWISAPAIADPSGGPTVDAEARLAIIRLLDHFRSEEHTSELQSHHDLVCRLLLEKKKKNK